jgi:hypothetical protein
MGSWPGTFEEGAGAERWFQTVARFSDVDRTENVCMPRPTACLADASPAASVKVTVNKLEVKDSLCALVVPIANARTTLAIETASGSRCLVTGFRWMTFGRRCLACLGDKAAEPLPTPPWSPAILGVP